MSHSSETGDKKRQERKEQKMPALNAQKTFKSDGDFSNFQTQLLDAIEQAVIATDLNGIVIYWNQFAHQVYGWTAAEVIGRNIMDVTTPETTVEQAEKIMSQVCQGKSWSGEFTVKRKDGTTFPVQITNSPIFNNKNILCGIVGISYDITERKRKEQALRESETKYRMLVEQASDGIHTYDFQGNFIETNSKLCEMLGYTAEELLRLNVKDLVVPEDLVENPIRYEELRAGKTVLSERRLRRKDGTLVPVEVSGRMIQDGVLQAIIRDITERKQAEEKLISNENQLRLITDAVPLLISYVDREHRYQFVNRSYTEWFGKSREEVIGKHLSEVLGQSAYRTILPKIERVLSGEEIVIEHLIPYESGKRFIHLNYIPDFDASSDQVLGFHAFVQDITERKKAEEVLRRSRHELESLVKERTQELGRANNALQLQMIERAEAEEARVKVLQRLITVQEDERRRLARDLHDQLGQQLTALRLKLEVLRKMCSGNEELYNQVAETQKLARELDTDIDSLVWQLRPPLLDDLGIITALDNYAQQWSMNFRISAYFNADRFGKTTLSTEAETNLYYIAQEALNNIAKHAQANRVNILLEPRDNSVVLIIEDDGIGFDTDKQIPAGNLTKGMGLIGMQERVSLVGGTLEIESAPGKGTTIYAKIPVLSAEKEQSNGSNSGGNR